MSSGQIVLFPPVPTSQPAFESICPPTSDVSLDDMRELTRSRLDLETHATNVVLAETKGVEKSPELLATARALLGSAETYQKLWVNFWRKYITFRGGKTVSTKLPLTFHWRVELFGNVEGSMEYQESSPLMETLCSSLALAVAHHRVAAHASGAAEPLDHLRRGRVVLEWCRDNVVPMFCPRRPVPPPTTVSLANKLSQPSRAHSRREPHVFAPSVWNGLIHVFTGQIQCREALATIVQKQPAIRGAVGLFRGAQSFKLAGDLMPSERVLTNAKLHSGAFGYRYLATALTETTDEFGVAIACAQEACENFPENQTLVTFMKTLEERNRIESFWKTVPDRHTIKLDFSKDAADVSVTTDADSVRIVVPTQVGDEG